MVTKSIAAQAVSVDDDAALERVLKLLAIPGPPGKEAAVMDAICEELRQAGVDERCWSFDDAHRHSPFGGEIGNLIVHLPGTRPGPTRLLMAHVDTVPLCVGAQPRVKGQFVVNQNPASALGADNRSGAAAILTALRELVRQGLDHPPLTFVWVVQEEIGLIGSRYLAVDRLQRPKLCFNWDGDEPGRVTIGAIGARRFTVQIRGVASHAGVAPEKGVNALVVASLAIGQLQRKGWHGLVRKGKQEGRANLGIVKGGNATNVVMAELTIEGELRSHDRAFQRTMAAAYKEAFRAACDRVRSIDGKRAKVTFRDQEAYRPFRIAEDEPPVRAACAAVRRLGLKPELYVANGGLDANSMALHGLPTVTLGAGQRNVHTVKERMHIPSFRKACRIALWLATAREDELLADDR